MGALAASLVEVPIMTWYSALDWFLLILVSLEFLGSLVVHWCSFLHACKVVEFGLTYKPQCVWLGNRVIVPYLGEGSSCPAWGGLLQRVSM